MRTILILIWFTILYRYTSFSITHYLWLYIILTSKKQMAKLYRSVTTNEKSSSSWTRRPSVDLLHNSKNSKPSGIPIRMMISWYSDSPAISLQTKSQRPMQPWLKSANSIFESLFHYLRKSSLTEITRIHSMYISSEKRVGSSVILSNGTSPSFS